MQKRLYREFVELQATPLPNIVVKPVQEENLSLWHGNISNPSHSSFQNLAIHFEIEFPTTYPVAPPIVRLFTFVSHLNLQPKDGMWEVCLDMLRPSPTGVTILYQYWSSAFSIRSVLMQMTSFVLAEEQGIGIENIPDAANLDRRCIEEANSFSCEACGHTNNLPSPAFPTSEELLCAPVSYPPIPVTDSKARRIQTRMYQRRMLSQLYPPPPHDHPPLQPQTLPLTPTPKPQHLSMGGGESVDNDQIWISRPLKKKNDGDGRIKNVNNTSEMGKANGKKQAPLPPSSSLLLSNPFAALASVPKKRSNKKEKKLEERDKDTKRPDQEVKFEREQSGIPAQANNKSQTEDPAPLDYPDWIARRNLLGVEVRNLGSAIILSKDIVTREVCGYLCSNDVISLGATCKAAFLVSEDWWIWRNLFRTRFPRSALRPEPRPSSESSGMQYQAWKHAYMLEVNRLSSEPRCFHSLASKEEDILGIPIEYTINPKSHELDFLTSTFDVIGFNAFSSGVRKTAWGERFSMFLPLYLDEDHFLQGLPHLLSLAVKLVGRGKSEQSRPIAPVTNIANNSRAIFLLDAKPNREIFPGKRDFSVKTSEPNMWTPRSPPEMVMSLLTKLMTTQVILLCDKGIAVSETALMGYCQVHRLFLAVIEHFPELKNVVANRLQSFVGDPEKRTKTHTPNIGDLLSLMSVSSSVSWKDLSFPMIMESFDRSVLWACTKDPSLATVVPGDRSRLTRYFQLQKVGYRLQAFHATFIDLLIHGGGSQKSLDDCRDRYDILQGRPPLCLQKEFSERVKGIIEMQNWPQFFELSRTPLPNPNQLLFALERAVENSLRKGYHSETTNFTNIHRSGVSKILLKGESYTTAPNVKRIHLSERWRFQGNGMAVAQYLDASCLIYDFQGHLQGTVDYHSTYRPAGCRIVSPIRHSGDIIDAGKGEGTHTIDIDLLSLPTNVATLVFTVSAWHTTLKAIKQPSCHIHDVDSDIELCHYQHEDVDTNDQTAVTMCKLHRSHPGGRWTMSSIGHLGMGHADDYSPIQQDIITHGFLNHVSVFDG